MGRAVLILTSDAIRARACEWVRKSPDGARLTFQAANDRLTKTKKFGIIRNGNDADSKW